MDSRFGSTRADSAISVDRFELVGHWRARYNGDMKSRIWLGAAFVVTSLIVFKTANPTQAEPVKDEQIKRGQYIVERVSMCADCHTPKTDKGEYDRTAWLQGDVLDFKPVHPMPFNPVAPQIAGLPTMATDEIAIKFFETGTNGFGKTALPPMPRFRFEHDDAVAVVAYLRSLKKTAPFTP